jgi:hypothetical protein
MARSFKDAFCARYSCTAKEFHDKAIATCLYPHARAVWPVLDLVGARTTFAASALVELVGQVDSEDDLKAVVEQYLQEVYPRMGWLSRSARLRVSTKRLIQLYRGVHASNATAKPAIPTPR